MLLHVAYFACKKLPSMSVPSLRRPLPLPQSPALIVLVAAPPSPLPVLPNDESPRSIPGHMVPAVFRRYVILGWSR